MTSNSKWKYKNNSLTFRPWMVNLLVDGSLKQKAQKVRVLKRNFTEVNKNGDVMKHVTDGVVFMKSFFTTKSFENFKHDRNDASSLDNNLLILSDYDVEYVFEDELKRCEFVLTVYKFSQVVDFSDFDHQYDPIHCMEIEDIRKKSSLLWEHYLARYPPSQGKGLDHSINSMPLTQLLDEMGYPSLDLEEGKASGKKESESTKDGLKTTERITTKCSLSTFDLKDFIISVEEERLLDVIPEWKAGFIPQQSVPSEVFSSSQSVEKINFPENTLKVHPGFSCKALCKNKSRSKEGVKSTQPKTTTTSDVEIQVSQSLWMDFLSRHSNKSCDIAVQAGSQLKKDSVTETSEIKCANEKDADAYLEDETLSPDMPEKTSSLHSPENDSFSILSQTAKPCPENKRCGRTSIMILDSVSNGDDSLTKSGRNAISSKVETSTGKGKTTLCGKDQNDNNNPDIIEIDSSEEILPTEKILDPKTNDIVTEIVNRNSLHSQGIVAMSEQQEESRLYRMKMNKTRGKQDDVGEKAILGNLKSLSSDNFQNKTSDLKEGQEKSRNSAYNLRNNKRRLSYSDSEITSKKVCDNTRDSQIHIMSENECLVTTKPRTRRQKSTSLHSSKSLRKSKMSERSFENKSVLMETENLNIAMATNNEEIVVMVTQDDVSKATEDKQNDIADDQENISMVTKHRQFGNEKVSIVTEDERTDKENISTEIEQIENSKESHLTADFVKNSHQTCVGSQLELSTECDQQIESILQDAQIVSSGELPSENNKLQSGVVTSSSEPIDEEIPTPNHSLPSYQPPKVMEHSTNTSLEHLQKSFWGVFEDEPVSEIGQSLLNLDFSGHLMKKFHRIFSKE